MSAGSSFDVAIVGGGIAGASLAWRLAAHRRVLVLEREPVLGLHATGRSSAMFVPSYGGPAARALTKASSRFMRRPPAGFGELLRPRPALHIAPASETARLAEVAAHIAEPRLLDAGQAARLVPILRRSQAAGGVLEPDAGDIDVAGLHGAFLRGARERGAVVLPRSGTAVFERRGGGWQIRGSETSISARIVVNAAGAWADAVAVALGARSLGLQPLRRTVALVAGPFPDGAADWPIVKCADEGFYARPLSGQLLVTPADETPSEPCDAQPDEIDLAMAGARFRAVMAHPLRRFSQSWAGLRTFTRDRAPVIGWDPQIDGLFWMAGLGGFGIQSSPAVSQLAAALLLGQRPETELGITVAALGPARFSGASVGTI